MVAKNHSKGKSAPGINKADEKGRHFSSITIENYRCFKDFSMGPFERVNLIGGMNNVGKTSLLESFALLLASTSIGMILKIDAFRGIDTFEGDANSVRETLWSHLFYDLDAETTISIKSELGAGGQVGITLKQIEGAATTLPLGESQSGNIATGIGGASTQALRLQYKDVSGKTYSVDLAVNTKGITVPSSVAQPVFPGIFQAARRRSPLKDIAVRYGQLEMSENHYELIRALQIVEPRLKRLSTIVGASGPMLYGEIGLGRMLPLAVMGEGLASLVSLLLAISSASGGVVLFDEIENGLHTSILTKAWQAIAETARRYNTQLFATTHSFECIEAAHKAFQTNDVYDFCYYRLQKANDAIEAVRIDEEALESAIESDWEIR